MDISPITIRIPPILKTSRILSLRFRQVMQRLALPLMAMAIDSVL
jgi:hypothetical protein